MLCCILLVINTHGVKIDEPKEAFTDETAKELAQQPNEKQPDLQKQPDPEQKREPETQQKEITILNLGPPAIQTFPLPFHPCLGNLQKPLKMGQSKNDT